VTRTVDQVLSCRELVELVTDYLDDVLADERRAEVLAHLQDCPDCLRYLGQVRSTRHLVAGTPRPRLAGHDRAAAIEAFRLWCRSGHAGRSARGRGLIPPG
jgi:anti-sigma factor RsiW